MKRRIALLMAVLMLVSLVGCGEKEQADQGGDKGNTQAQTQTQNDTAKQDTKKDEQTTLTMWCIATESDSNRPAYEKAIAQYETNNPNVKLAWEAFENESYKTKIKSAVSANEMPDIFFTWSCAFLGDFVKAGRVYCVDDVYKNYAKDLPESMLSNVKYDGKYYGVPLTMNIVCMFANLDMLKEVGYNDVPATYDELIKCCDKLIAAGKIPFGCAGRETWCVTEYLESIIEKTAGASVLSDIFAGNATWGNADVEKAVGLFQDMITKNYFDPAGLSLSNDEIKQNFLDGKYAFYINGSWNCASFYDEETGAYLPKFTAKVSEFPVIDATKSELGQLIGGPSDTLAVAASSKNAALAADAAFQLGKEICHYGYLAGSGLPAWTPDYDTSSINELTQSVAKICENAKAYVLFGDTAMASEPAQIYLDYVGQIYASMIDGKQFVNGLKNDLQ